MADNDWQDVSSPQDEWQDVRQPADANLEQKADFQWRSSNPGLATSMDNFNQMVFNPLAQAANAVIPIANGINKIMGPSDDTIPQIPTPNMSNAPIAAKVLGNLAGGATQGVAATMAGGGNPILGYGALGGLSAYGKGQNPIVGAGIGAVSGIPQMIAGGFGSSLASALAKPLGNTATRLAPRFGTALGMGGASAGQAAMTGQNPVEAGISGATFGALSPMNPMGVINPEQHENIMDNGTQMYRDILNPAKGIIQKVEIKSGKDLNDAFNLAAREGLVINKDANNKLDTTGAIAQLQPKINNLQQQLTTALSSDPHKQFDLEDVRDAAKDNLSNTIKNAQDLNSAHNQIDAAIDAEISRNGQFVNGSQLNNIKQGLWNKAYDPLSPNSNSVSRQIGNVAKTMIEQGYPQTNIQNLNGAMGKYINLQNILQASHGNIVQSGKLGKYAAQGAGAIAGGLVGSHLPFLGEIAGPIAGFEAGGRVSDYMNDPGRITSNWANKIKNLRVIDNSGVTTNASTFNPLNRTASFTPIRLRKTP